MDHGSKTRNEENERGGKGEKQVERNSTQRAEVTMTRPIIPVVFLGWAQAGNESAPHMRIECP